MPGGLEKAVVNRSSEKCPSFEVLGALGSHSLFRPNVNRVNNLCLAQSDPRLQLGRPRFALGLFQLLLLLAY